MRDKSRIRDKCRIKDSEMEAENSSNIASCKGNVYTSCSITINDVKVLALIDTGSSVNIIQVGMLERLRLGKHKLHPNTKRLSEVTGKFLNTKGRLSQVPICLNPNKEIQNEVDLLVVTDVTEDLILGQQFLSRYKFIVDFNRNRLWND